MFYRKIHVMFKHKKNDLKTYNNIIVTTVFLDIYQKTQL